MYGINLCHKRSSCQAGGTDGAGSHSQGPGRRARVSREQVLDAALAIADEGGLSATTMASVGARLGVEAMSLYRHIGNKEEMLDGLVDRVFAEIQLPRDTDDWRDTMRRRAVSANEALRRHPWAIGLMESRTQPGPATLGQSRRDRRRPPARRVLRPRDDAHLQPHRQLRLRLRAPGGDPAVLHARGDGVDERADAGGRRRRVPHLAAIQRELVGAGFVYADEFEAGLDIIMRARAGASGLDVGAAYIPSPRRRPRKLSSDISLPIYSPTYSKARPKRSGRRRRPGTRKGHGDRDGRSRRSFAATSHTPRATSSFQPLMHALQRVVEGPPKGTETDEDRRLTEALKDAKATDLIARAVIASCRASELSGRR